MFFFLCKISSIVIKHMEHILNMQIINANELLSN
jgi:hypothetical protein